MVQATKEVAPTRTPLVELSSLPARRKPAIHVWQCLQELPASEHPESIVPAVVDIRAVNDAAKHTQKVQQRFWIRLVQANLECGLLVVARKRAFAHDQPHAIGDLSCDGVYGSFTTSPA